jgi:hypothetical protein
MLLYDAEMGHIDAVYVNDLNVISSITIKIFQVLLEIQKLKLPVYFNQGCIKAEDRLIKDFHDKMVAEWEKIKEDSKEINF